MALALSACGGGGTADTDSSIASTPSTPFTTTTADEDTLSAVDKVTSVTAANRSADLYRTAGATRAIVALHGGAGNKTAIAFQLAMNDNATSATTETVNWPWLDAHQVSLVLPQGLALPDSGVDGATTWDNHAMLSGADDVAYLQALAAKLRAKFGFTHITLMGHSMGGVMTNRMWCESPGTFDAYVSLAGPASTYYDNTATPCAPGAAAKPYLGIMGDSDEVMQTSGAWFANTWTVAQSVRDLSPEAWVNPYMIGEFRQQKARALTVCNETLTAGAYTTAPGAPNVKTWTSCGGRAVLKGVQGAGHGVSSLDDFMGGGPTDVMDAVIGFVSAL